MDVVHFHGGYEASADSHEFSLDCCDIYGLDLESFDDGIVGPDVNNCCSDMGFFNTVICNDSSAVGVYLRCWYKSSSDKEEGEWKLILLEK